jgi:hypothetical protein
VIAYGYRYGEVPLAKIMPIKVGTKITMRPRRDHDTNRRGPALVSTGPHVHGAALPHPDLDDTWTAVAGVRKRAAFAPPVPKKQLLERLKRFVRLWLARHLVPLDADTDITFQTWLDNAPYPAWRKEQLKAEWEACENPFDKKLFEVSCFIKDETYVSYKHARGIYSRSDVFKCLVGPIFKSIENIVYKDPHFIKHIPVCDRPKYIFEKLYRENGKYYATDYTAFESLFTKEIMESVEFQLYDYMTQNLSAHSWFMDVCHTVLAGRNICRFKDFKVELEATRMSGEMCTSLGNGFSNLMFMLFMCSEKGVDVDGVVEGDDGLFVIDGEAPTEDDFKQLGLVLRMEKHDSLATASFCGIVFDEVDQKTITDPRDVLASFGWTSRQYANAKPGRLRELLRCKSLSLAYQYPGCPIISALADYGLRVTSGVDIRRVLDKDRGTYANEWYRNRLKQAMDQVKNVPRAEVGIRTRLLTEHLYGIPVFVQVSIEQYLDNKTDLGPLQHPLIDSLMAQDWKDYWNEFVRPYDSSSLHYPTSLSASVPDFEREF